MATLASLLLFVVGAASTILTLIACRNAKEKIPGWVLIVVPVLMLVSLIGVLAMGWINVPSVIYTSIFYRVYTGIAVGMLWARFVPIPR